MHEYFNSEQFCFVRTLSYATCQLHIHTDIHIQRKERGELNQAVKGRRGSWMVVQLQNGIATPDGNGDTIKEMAGRNGRARRGSFCLTAWPIVQIVKFVSSATPPKVSITKGMKSIPTKQQPKSWEDSFHSTPTWMAWSRLEATSPRVCCCRGKMTCTWTAAGTPRLQLGRKISAGLASLVEDLEYTLIELSLHTELHRRLNLRCHCVGKCSHHCHHSSPDDLHKG